ncbi:MAG: histidinol dehydrogenase [Fimbriimonadaceae bacterium]|nr:histidinol dehydrogenase [Fimbriimonadaceae bacterium]
MMRVQRLQLGELPDVSRQFPADPTLERTVAEIIADVARRGDGALIESAQRFDTPSLGGLAVDDDELRQPVNDALEAALALAAQRIRAFHDAQRAQLLGGGDAWNMPGSGIGQRLLPVKRAGIYVPGGRATYPSSVLMNAIPALSAGVGEIVLTSPAAPEGRIAPILAAALRHVPGVRAFKVGGAAAIAAMALGTKSVPQCDVIAGPGNRYVNEAKRQLWGRVGLDGYAGPSEMALYLAPDSSVGWAAQDVLTQIEHAPDNAAYVVTSCDSTLLAFLSALDRALAVAPRRAVMTAALRDRSIAYLVKDRHHAVDCLNAIAPEHLTVTGEHAERIAAKVSQAGCVLIGDYSAESLGDYLAGPSHTLPTNGAARWQSPVNVMTFLRFQSRLHVESAELAPLADAIITLAEAEGLPTHAEAIRARFR